VILWLLDLDPESASRTLIRIQGGHCIMDPRGSGFETLHASRDQVINKMDCNDFI